MVLVATGSNNDLRGLRKGGNADAHMIFKEATGGSFEELTDEVPDAWKPENIAIF